MLKFSWLYLNNPFIIFCKPTMIFWVYRTISLVIEHFDRFKGFVSLVWMKIVINLIIKIIINNSSIRLRFGMWCYWRRMTYLALNYIVFKLESRICVDPDLEWDGIYVSHFLFKDFQLVVHKVYELLRMFLLPFKLFVFAFESDFIIIRINGGNSANLLEIFV